MRYLMLVALLACAACAHRAHLTDTPIGDYDGTWGPVTRPAPAGAAYRCNHGGTEVIVRGAKNPDPQACKPVERI